MFPFLVSGIASILAVASGIGTIAHPLLALDATRPAQLTAQVAAAGTTLKVGPDKPYKKVSDAYNAARAGDTIEIDAGVYENDPFCIQKDNLTFRGVGNGYAHMEATALPGKLPPVIANGACAGQGIWAVRANNITVENIEFSGSKNGTKNGSGIRGVGGANLTIRHSYFHNNQDGILIGVNLDSTLVIENSEFAFNGAGDGQSHNMYIGVIKSFTLRNSYTHDAKVGHNVKTRAHTNYIIGNRITDEAGNPSYDIDINGGVAYVIGNIIQKSAGADNPGTSIFYWSRDYVAEYPNDPRELYVVNNTIVSDVKRQGQFVRVLTDVSKPVVTKVINNLFVGGTNYLPLNPDNNGVPVSGAISTAINNLQIPLNAPDLVNKAAYDYHLTADSAAINAGVDPGSANGFSLSPSLQYVHPFSGESRTVVGTAIDIGAYEFTGTPTHENPLPVVSLSSVASTLDTSSTLTWSSNATSCTGSGGWTGSQSTNGTFNTGPVSRSTDYTISCKGLGGITEKSVTVLPPAPPVVTFTATHSSVLPGTGSFLIWTSKNAAACKASGAWPGPTGLVGQYETGPLDASRTYTISCDGLSGGVATKSVTVTVAGSRIETPAPVPVFQLKADQSGAKAVTQTGSVTPAIGPAGVLRVRGTGQVHFVPTPSGQGVYFGPGNQQNKNAAFYEFTPSASQLHSLFNEDGGEIGATIIGRYTRRERSLALVNLQNSGHAVETVLSTSNGKEEVAQIAFDFYGALIFSARAPGAPAFNYRVPAGVDDTIFGNGKSLKIRLTWDGTIERMYLNDVMVATQTYTKQAIVWGSGSMMVLGSFINDRYGPGFRALVDPLDNFSILGSVRN